MKRLLRRQGLGYALGLLTAVGGFAVGTAWAGHAADDNTIVACADHDNGTLYLLDRGKKPDGCQKKDTTVTWNSRGPQGIQGPKGDQGDRGAQGVQGPAGTIDHAKSTNGLYSIVLGNQGITLKGPFGKVVVDSQGAHVVTIGGTP